MHSEINIWDLVKSLLHKHDCVILPGFGGFVCKTESARINPVSNVIIPPHKFISFNAKLNLNDGLLATHISNCNGLTYFEAIKLIEEKVNSVNKSLTTEGILVIDSIGTFELNNDKNIVFSPEKNANFMLASFGLNEVKLISNSTSSHTKILNKVAPVVLETSLKNSEVLNKQHQINSKSETASIHKHKSVRKSRRGLFYSLTGTFLVLIMSINAYVFLQNGILAPIINRVQSLDLSSTFNSWISKIEFESKKETIVPKVKAEISKPINTIDATTNLESKITSELPIDQKTELTDSKINIEYNSDVTPKPTDNMDKVVYYIITGAFNNEWRAENLQSKLSEGDFPESEIILKPLKKSNNKYKLVTLKKFTNLYEASNALISIQGNYNPDAWIYAVQ